MSVRLAATLALASAALFAAAPAEAQFRPLPVLPVVFQAVANFTITNGAAGKSPVRIYYDGEAGHVRLDVLQFGSFRPRRHVVQLFDYAQQFDAADGGRCVVSGAYAATDLIPLTVPQGSFYRGPTTVPWLPGVTLDLWGGSYGAGVSANWTVLTRGDGTATLVRFRGGSRLLEVDPHTTSAGALDAHLFDVTQFGCPAPSRPETISVSGYCLDAETERPVHGCSMQSRFGNVQGAPWVVRGVHAKDSERTLPLLAEAAGYFSFSELVHYSSFDVPAGTGQADAYLTRWLDHPNQFRAVLRWNNRVSDLNLYAVVNGGCTAKHTNRRCTGPQGGTATSIGRDVRHAVSPGVELVSLETVPGSPTLFEVWAELPSGYKNGDVQAQIYQGRGTAVKGSGVFSSARADAKYWHIFDVVDQTITVRNELVG